MTEARGLTRSQLVAAIKRRGIRQLTIAQRAGVSQGYVSNVWRRRFRGSDKSERVWRVTEEMLA